MAKEPESIEESTDIFAKKEPKTKTEKHCSIQMCYEVIHYLSKSHQKLGIGSRSNLIPSLALVYEFLQIVSLLYYIEMPLQDWRKYKLIWESIYFSRVDYLCSYFQIEDFLIYFSLLISAAPLASFAVLATQKLSKRKLSLKLRKLVFEVPMSLATEVLPIPVTCIALTQIKYYFSDANYITEYNLASSLELHPSIPVALVLVSFLLKLTKLLFFFETNHDSHERVPLAKSNEFPDLVKFAGFYTQAFLFYFLMPTNSYLFQTLSVGINVFVGCCYVKYLPYYRTKINTGYSSCSFCAAWFSSALLVGLLLDNASLTCTMILFITPFVVFVSHQVVVARENYFASKLELSSHSKQWECELILRPLFKDRSKITDLASFMDTVSNNKELAKHSMLFVWESYYYFSKLNDPVSARLKLCNAKQKLSPPKGFQVFKCTRLVESDKETETFKFLKFHHDFKQTLELDKKFCNNLLRAVAELASNKPSSKKVRKSTKVVYSQLNQLKAMYKHLLTKNKNHLQANLLYGKLLYDFLNSPSEGTKFLSIEMKTAKNSALHELSPFDQKSSVIVVSCSPLNFCLIEHANENALKLLNYTDLTGVNFTTLLPHELDSMHVKFMQNFSSRITKYQFSLPEFVFLKQSSGFLTPVQMQLKLDAINNCPYFVTTFKPYSELNGEAALLNCSGKILGHTEGFTQSLRLCMDSLTGQSYSSLNGKFAEAYENPFHPITLEEETYLFGVRIHVNQTCLVSVIVIQGHEKLLTWEDYFAPDSEFLTHDTCFNPFEMPPEEPQETPQVRFTEDLETPESEENHNIDPESHLICGSKKTGKTTYSSASTHTYREKQEESSRVLARVSSAVRNVTYATAVALFLFTGLNVMATVLFNETVERGLEAGSMHHNIALRSRAMLVSAHISRQLDLKSRGFDFLVPLNYYMDILKVVAEELQRSNTKIRNDAKNWQTEAYSSLYFSNIVPTWFLENKTPKIQNENLFDLSSMFDEHLQRVKQKFNSNLTLDDPSVFFLFQNGHGQGLKYSNSSQSLYKGEEEVFIQNLYLSVYIAYIVSGFQLALAAFLIGFKLFQLQKASDETWNKIFELKNESLTEVLAKLQNRLESIDSHTQAIELPFSDRSDSPQRYKPWVPVVLALVVLLAFIGVYFFLFLIDVNDSVSFIKMRPQYLQAYISLLCHQISSYEWTKEIVLSQTPVSLARTFKYPSFFSSPEYNFQQSIQSTLFFNEYFDTFLDSDQIELGGEIEKIFLLEANSQSVYFCKGLHKAMTFYYVLLQEISEMSWSQLAYQELLQTIALSVPMLEHFESVTYNYVKFVEASVLRNKSSNILKTGILSILFLVFFLVISQIIMPRIQDNINSGYDLIRKLDL